MYCKSCGHIIKTKITFRNFIDKAEHQICRRCFRQYQNKNPYLVLPIEKSIAHVYELLYDSVSHLDAYDSYLNAYIISFLVYKDFYTLLIFNELDKKTYDDIQCLNVGPLVVLTIKIKGELFYEI